MTTIKALIGKTIDKIDGGVESRKLVFHTSDGLVYAMYHIHVCCEDVYVDDIIGNLEDIIGSPVLRASEETSDENPEGVKKEYQDSFTWTFYHIATIKGAITIRWYGESNGCYSEDVSFLRS